ncbi:MAG TPA: class I SAM-dependent methyltransferase, partial [Alicycliphilus sp.]|nr:class I SAM-dependent methyltransferase [Alicycliphilus sp.]
ARVAAKACAEMAPGGWLVSLAFEVPGQRACAHLPAFAGQGVWIYRIGAMST